MTSMLWLSSVSAFMAATLEAGGNGDERGPVARGQHGLPGGCGVHHQPQVWLHSSPPLPVASRTHADFAPQCLNRVSLDPMFSWPAWGPPSPLDFPDLLGFPLVPLTFLTCLGSP